MRGDQAFDELTLNLLARCKETRLCFANKEKTSSQGKKGKTAIVFPPNYQINKWGKINRASKKPFKKFDACLSESLKNKSESIPNLEK